MKLLFGFSHGRSRVQSGYGVCSRLWTCHAGSCGSASLQWGPDLIPYVDAHRQRRTRGSASITPMGNHTSTVPTFDSINCHIVNVTSVSPFGTCSERLLIRRHL